MSAVLKPAQTRDALMPREPRGLGLGLVLALIAHALLIVALAFGVNWRASEPQGVQAELWSAVPQAAAPRLAEPEPTPPAPEPKPQPKPAEPVVKPEPAQPDPQIAIEQAKRDEAKRQQALDEQRERDKKQREKDQRDAAERDQQRAELERKKRDAEKDKVEAAKLAATREANLKRMLGQAGATGGPTATGTAAQSSGPSAGYAGRIMAQIKRNIVFNDTVSANPVASVELRLAPDGTILSRRLLKSSGSPAWDDAVLRAIDKTAVLPRDIDGRVPPVMQIDSRPYE